VTFVKKKPWGERVGVQPGGDWGGQKDRFSAPDHRPRMAADKRPLILEKSLAAPQKTKDATQKRDLHPQPAQSGPSGPEWEYVTGELFRTGTEGS